MQDLKDFCETDTFRKSCEVSLDEMGEKETEYENSSTNEEIINTGNDCKSDLRSSMASGGVDRIDLVTKNKHRPKFYTNVYDSLDSGKSDR